MPIYVNEETLTFHLSGRGVSYLFKVLPNQELTHLYYGKALAHVDDFNQLFYTDIKDNSCFEASETPLSFDYIRGEYPSFGRSDFREPAIQLKDEAGSRVTAFRYQGYQIKEGKAPLAGLPATYVESDQEATTLTVTMYDAHLDTSLDLNYTVFSDYPVITRHVTLTNQSDQQLAIDRLMSASLDFNHDQWDWMELHGSWARERHVKRQALHPGIQKIGSTRGTSSAQHNPFFALLDPDATEHQGEVYGFSLVYSSNFLAQCEVDHYQTTRVMLGINPFDFSYLLRPGETFVSPEVVMVYSDAGLNKMSQVYHDLYRNRLARGHWRDKLRPVLINNWEATYFDFDETKLLAMATEAKALGVDLFVLDDGWFKGRNSDQSSLGDWYVDQEKLPHGLGALSDKITELGLMFGLWIEPEMVSRDSDLYRAHPEWVIQVPDRDKTIGRYQYVLDFANPDVVDYIYQLIKQRLSEAKVSYVKWDMNRYMTEVASRRLDPGDQQSVRHRYILGVYRLYERLTNDFPDVLFESCASGGARFDPGMLYYAPQAWTSDNTDAVERINIQYGSSMVYPLSMMGAHVSAVPNHQTHRITPLETRGVVSFSGMLGYELDPSQLTETEKAIVKQQITTYKQIQETVQTGTFTRLLSPFDDHRRAAWMVKSQDETEVLVTFVQLSAIANPGFRQLKLKALQPKAQYQLVGSDAVFYGDQLMHHGIELDRYIDRSDAGDYRGYLLHFKALKGEDN